MTTKTLLKLTNMTAVEKKDIVFLSESYDQYIDKRDTNAIKIYDAIQKIIDNLKTYDDLKKTLETLEQVINTKSVKKKSVLNTILVELATKIVPLAEEIKNKKLKDNETGTVWREFPYVERNEEGRVTRVLNHSENTSVLFQNNNVRVAYNELIKEVEIEFNNKTFHSEIKNTSQLSALKDLCEIHYVPYSLIEEHIVSIANRNTYHPVKVWMDELKWDGVSRIEELVGTVTLDNDTSYELAHMLIKKWLVMGAAAILRPEGISPQGVLTTVGPQGIGKTSWVRTLSPVSTWITTDMQIDPHNKDDVIRFVKNWIVELGELDATFRKADMAALKSFITRQSDEFRAPFGKKPEKYVRRTIFYASVNKKEFLYDDENRRFWPLGVTAVNKDHNVNMVQVWAEAKYLYEQGETFWLSETERQMLHSHNKSFSAASPIEEFISTRLRKPTDNEEGQKLNCTDILLACGWNARIDRVATNDVAKWLKANDYEFINNGKRQYRVVTSVAPMIQRDTPADELAKRRSLRNSKIDDMLRL